MMRILYLLIVIYVGLALTSCASIEKPSNKSSDKYKQPAHKKMPHKVSFYKGKPNRPYTVIGEERISRYTQGGGKRQAVNIHDGMRELAAAMGGDAVINIKHDPKSISGTIIAFQKPTLNISQG